MTSFLDHLVGRTLGTVPSLQPRPRALFEPAPGEQPADTGGLAEVAPPADVPAAAEARVTAGPTAGVERPGRAPISPTDPPRPPLLPVPAAGSSLRDEPDAARAREEGAGLAGPGSALPPAGASGQLPGAETPTPEVRPTQSVRSPSVPGPGLPSPVRQVTDPAASSDDGQRTELPAGPPRDVRGAFPAPDEAARDERADRARGPGRSAESMQPRRDIGADVTQRTGSAGSIPGDGDGDSTEPSAEPATGRSLEPQQVRGQHPAPLDMTAGPVGERPAITEATPGPNATPDRRPAPEGERPQPASADEAASARDSSTRSLRRTSSAPAKADEHVAGVSKHPGGETDDRADNQARLALSGWEHPPTVVQSPGTPPATSSGTSRGASRGPSRSSPQGVVATPDVAVVASRVDPAPSRVQVHIGRVVVTHPAPAAVAPHPPPPPGPTVPPPRSSPGVGPLSLEDYLRRRDGGSP